jgi:hypothetical protein
VTIEKGQAWGVAGGLADDGVLVHSDAEARAVVEKARRAGDPVPPLGLLGGDLCRTMGGTGDEAHVHDPASMRLPVDLGAVLIDGRMHWFVAHLVARRSWWHGRIVAAMNAEFHGRWDVAPRSHPNDGLLDVFDVTMGLGDRLKARSRLPAGAHVPHPAIAQSRSSAIQLEFTQPLDIWLDGERMGRARTLSVRVEPDALTCVV